MIIIVSSGVMAAARPGLPRVMTSLGTSHILPPGPGSGQTLMCNETNISWWQSKNSPHLPPSRLVTATMSARNPARLGVKIYFFWPFLVHKVLWCFTCFVSPLRQSGSFSPLSRIDSKLLSRFESSARCGGQSSISAASLTLLLRSLHWNDEKILTLSDDLLTV